MTIERETVERLKVLPLTPEAVGEALILARATEVCTLADMLRTQSSVAKVPAFREAVEKACVAMENRAAALRKLAGTFAPLWNREKGRRG